MDECRLPGGLDAPRRRLLAVVMSFVPFLPYFHERISDRRRYARFAGHRVLIAHDSASAGRTARISERRAFTRDTRCIEGARETVNFRAISGSRAMWTTVHRRLRRRWRAA